MAKKGKRKAAPGDVATNRQASLPLRPAREVRGRHRAHRHRGQVAARRQGAAQGRLRDGRDGEVWLHNVHIPPYAPGGAREPRARARRASCSLHRREIERLIGKTAGARADARARRGSTSRARTRRSRSRSARGKDVRDKRETIRSARCSARWSARCARPDAERPKGRGDWKVGRHFRGRCGFDVAVPLAGEKAGVYGFSRRGVES